MFLAVGSGELGNNSGALKGRPPPRPVPDDFDVIFVEQGRDGCEGWYRAHKTTVTRWLEERGKARLIKARADFVKHQRGQGKWITRSTRLVEHRDTGRILHSVPIKDRRKVSFTLARHAAQYLRIVRNGGFIVSPAGDNEWWVGSRRYSAAQMVDFATAKGFERNKENAEQSDENGHTKITGRRGADDIRSAYLKDWESRMRAQRNAADLRLGSHWRDDATAPPALQSDDGEGVS